MSVETTLGPQRVSGGGVLKRLREPVVVLVGARREGAYLSCDWLFTHPGLLPGAYELVDGPKVVIPSSLCSDAGKASHGVTLEVSTE